MSQCVIFDLDAEELNQAASVTLPYTVTISSGSEALGRIGSEREPEVYLCHHHLLGIQPVGSPPHVKTEHRSTYWTAEFAESDLLVAVDTDGIIHSTRIE